MAQHEDHPGRKIARLERKVAGLQAGQRTVAQLSRIVLHKLEIEVAAAREQRDLAEAMLEQAYAAAFGSIGRSEGMGAEDIGAELALAGQMLNAACDRLDELGYRWDAEGGWVLREPPADDASPHALASARRTLHRLQYTFHGGQQWKPPIGKPPAWLADEPDAPAVEKPEGASDEEWEMLNGQEWTEDQRAEMRGETADPWAGIQKVVPLLILGGESGLPKKPRLTKNKHGWDCIGFFGGLEPVMVIGDGPTPEKAYASMVNLAKARGEPPAEIGLMPEVTP